MSTVLTDPTFDAFPVKRMKLDYYGLTQYDTEFQNVKVIYEPQSFVNTMGEYLSNQDYKQFRIAETENMLTSPSSLMADEKSHLAERNES